MSRPKTLSEEEKMFRRILKNKNSIFNRAVSPENIVHPTRCLKDLKENQKPSIVSDTTFKTMMYSNKRLIYPARILSCFMCTEPRELEKELTLYKGDIDKEKIDDKAERVDFICKYGTSKLQIEMNNNSSKKNMERNIDYLAKLYIEDNKEGTEDKFYPILQININNFSFVGDDTTVDIFPLQNDRGEVLTYKIIFIMIYIPNLYKVMYNKGIDGLSDLEKCILAMADEDIKLSNKLITGDDIMSDYVKDVKNASSDSTFQKEYTLEFRAEERGMERGFDKGVSKTKREVAEKMLQKNMSIEDIVEISGLSKKEIEEIKKV